MGVADAQNPKTGSDGLVFGGGGGKVSRRKRGHSRTNFIVLTSFSLSVRFYDL